MKTMLMLGKTCAAVILVLFGTFGISQNSNAVEITFDNQCAFPIWVGQFNMPRSVPLFPNADNAGDQWKLPVKGDNHDGTATITIPDQLSSVRFWPRTGCTWDGTHLNCLTGQCGGFNAGEADCIAAKTTGQNPQTLVELTTQGSPNYDVSLVNGYNVKVNVAIEGTTCDHQTADCTTDLLETCPANLRTLAPMVATAPGQTSIACGEGYCPTGKCIDQQCVVGCYAPGDQCLGKLDPAQNPTSPVEALKCNEIVPSATDGTKFLDMYLVKNYSGPDAKMNHYDGDNVAMRSANSGTPTCFADTDCPVHRPDCTFSMAANGDFEPPAGAGVCIDRSKNGATNQLLTPVLCRGSAIGSSCGFAADYTCQNVSYAMSNTGVMQQTVACLPPTTIGLGSVAGDNLYEGAGGVFNQAWVDAGHVAGEDGMTYYEIFKNACPRAYAWQYDDISSNFFCEDVPTSMAITFCAADHEISELTACGYPPDAFPRIHSDPELRSRILEIRRRGGFC